MELLETKYYLHRGLFVLSAQKEKKRVAVEMQLHSDQGFQYTSQAYFKLTQSFGITPSMSSKGNPYNNAMAENFFSFLKTACIYGINPKPSRKLMIRLTDTFIFTTMSASR